MGHYTQHLRFPKVYGDCSVEAYATLMNAAPVVMFCSQYAQKGQPSDLVFHVARVTGNLELEFFASHTSRLMAMDDFDTIVQQWTQS